MERVAAPGLAANTIARFTDIDVNTYLVQNRISKEEFGRRRTRLTTRTTTYQSLELEDTILEVTAHSE